jgi:DMSO/TMAO reductase YedYZ molybdopterin-dependent catalytic subunit
MNGERLPRSHGFPVRALIPGWYGMDSVKWLERIEVLRDGSNDKYLRHTRAGQTEAVGGMGVKAVFARPLNGARLFGRRFTARGAAWAGESQIRRVAISVNQAVSWQPAKLLDVPKRYTWVRWEYEWNVAGAGNYQLAVRAEDDEGRTQPPDRIPARLDEYEQNAWQRVNVVVV